jgi:hypothetical protein
MSELQRLLAELERPPAPDPQQVLLDLLATRH